MTITDIETTSRPRSATVRSLRASGFCTPAARAVAALEAFDCRWPIGWPEEEQFRFCGARRLPTGSYCATHARLNRAGERA